MIFDFYNKFGALNSGPVFDAFAQGLKKHGHSVQEHSGTGDVAVIWSVLWAGRMSGNRSVWNHYRNNNRPVIVLEIGAIKREVTWKIGINGINLGSYFFGNGKNSDRRNNLGMNLHPWKTSGNHILICSQHDRSLQWTDNPSLKDWTRSMISEIRKYSNRPIKIRMHPRCPYSFTFDNSVYKSTEKNILNEFQNAWAVINYSSNPGIESIIHGIPAFVGHKSLAAPVANLDISRIESPLRPDREQWFNDLAWTEWTTDEMVKGIPQQYILDYLQFSKITGS